MTCCRTVPALWHCPPIFWLFPRVGRNVEDPITCEKTNSSRQVRVLGRDGLGRAPLFWVFPCSLGVWVLGFFGEFGIPRSRSLQKILLIVQLTCQSHLKPLALFRNRPKTKSSWVVLLIDPISYIPGGPESQLLACLRPMALPWDF